MRISKQRTAVALAAAIALASGAYALGSQAGDGAAVAAGAANAPRDVIVHRGGPPGLDGLADRLGVEADALEDALRDLRGTLAPGGDRRPDGEFAKELADELGTTEAKVEAALERLRARHEREHEARRADLAKQLAERLKLDAADVQDALEDFGPPHPGMHRRP